MERLITIITDNGVRMETGQDADSLLKTFRKEKFMQEISDKIGENQYARTKAVCSDCGEEFVMHFERVAEDRIEIKNGAIGKRYGNYIFKCQGCFDKNDFFDTNTEVYSRVVGYLRPVNSWNDAKKNEFNQRKTYKVE
jgi:anaerobic ribonucleoside-triphosphate reductase